MGLGLSGEDMKVFEKEREGTLVVGVVEGWSGEGWSGDWAVGKNGASTEASLGVRGVSAAEDSGGEGVGVPDLDESFGITSKGLVFTCDDGNMVGGREEGTWESGEVGVGLG